MIVSVIARLLVYQFFPQLLPGKLLAAGVNKVSDIGQAIVALKPRHNSRLQSGVEHCATKDRNLFGHGRQVTKILELRHTGKELTTSSRRSCMFRNGRHTNKPQLRHDVITEWLNWTRMSNNSENMLTLTKIL